MRSAFRRWRTTASASTALATRFASPSISNSRHHQDVGELGSSPFRAARCHDAITSPRAYDLIMVGTVRIERTRYPAPKAGGSPFAHVPLTRSAARGTRHRSHESDHHRNRALKWQLLPIFPRRAVIVVGNPAASSTTPALGLDRCRFVHFMPPLKLVPSPGLEPGFPR